jgi:SAM-dependent methyltransferase
MRYDIDRLEAFYASPLGKMALEMISGRLAALWPDATGLDVLGFGHAAGLLDNLRPGARRVISANPEEQGAIRWPDSGPSQAVLTEEDRLPFIDALFDRVVIFHGLEEAESPQRLLREIWRVCAPEARVLIVAANRSGLWARSEGTPFGHGRPFTRSQLYRLLESAMFQPTASARALYSPPVNWRLFTSAGEAWERIGRLAWGGFGGVVMIEAVKRIHIEPTARRARVRWRSAPAPAASPIPASRETAAKECKTTVESV